jgi:Fe-S cluster biogenesis protein NfuA
LIGDDLTACTTCSIVPHSLKQGIITDSFII